MRVLIFILLAIMTTTKQCNENNQQPDFQLIKATKQNVYPGRQETGWWTTYELKIVPAFSSNELKFDTLWIGSKTFYVQTHQKGKKVKNNTFGKGDTVYITVNYNHGKFTMGRMDVMPPFEYKGEALLSYSLNGKRKYFVIKSFEKLPDKYYP